jgi:hypothetical protein
MQTEKSGCRNQSWCGLRSNAHMRAYDGVRRNAHAAVKLRALGDHSCWMDVKVCHRKPHAIVRMVHISSASQASSSPTRVMPLNLKTPAFARSKLTSMTN